VNSKYVKRYLDRSDYNYWKKLSQLPPTETIWPDEPEPLPVKLIGPQDKCLYGVDVRVNGRPLVGYIDNCCVHYCSIATELAEELGVRPIGKKVAMNGNKNSVSYIGIVDSISIGSLVVKNVLVDVSDNITAIQAMYPSDIIIGGNVLRRVGDMVIDNEKGTVMFTDNTLDMPANMTWSYSDHDYIVEAIMNGRPVRMMFDMGNTDTYLNQQYNDRFPEDTAYVKGTMTTNMIDRTWTSHVYVIENPNLEFCGAECRLPSVVIKLKDYTPKPADGNIGVNALRQFKKIVYNADKLYLQLVLFSDAEVLEDVAQDLVGGDVAGD
jgi:predicted aspartyl protease